MQKISIFLLEDDASWMERVRRELITLLKEYANYDFHIKGFPNGNDMFMNHDQEGPPDLIISDIQLNPESDAANGIDVIKKARHIWPDISVIYLTQYLTYATDIFETKPIYFLIKDQFPHKLRDAIELFLTEYKNLRRAINVISENKPTTIRLDGILYCEHSGKNTIIVCKHGRHPVRSSISQIGDLLPAEDFVPCHKSFLVSCQHIRSYTQKIIQMDDGSEIPVSRNFYAAFRTAYTNWLSRLI